MSAARYPRESVAFQTHALQMAQAAWRAHYATRLEEVPAEPEEAPRPPAPPEDPVEQQWNRQVRDVWDPEPD